MPVSWPSSKDVTVMNLHQIRADVGAPQRPTPYTVQYCTALTPMTIAIALDSATKLRGFSAACQFVRRYDFAARTTPQRMTAPNITKLASIPKPPPIQAPSDSRFSLEEYTAKSATAFCRVAKKRAATHRIVPSSNVFKSAQCSCTFWLLPTQSNDMVTVFSLSKKIRADVSFGLIAATIYWSKSQ